MESAATSCALRTDSDAFWSWLGEAVAQTTVAANRNHTAQGDFILFSKIYVSSLSALDFDEPSRRCRRSFVGLNPFVEASK